MSFPAPTRRDHQHFCATERWERIHDARGRTGTHHLTYRLDLPGGRILRTRISHPPDRTGYGPSLWCHILRDQLQVSERAFWSCVREGVPPDRGQPAQPADAVPVAVIRVLTGQVGLTEAEVARMTKAEAIERVARYWTERR